MGSTVVLLLGPGAPSLTDIDPGTPLRLGRALTHRADSRAVAGGAHG
jgi:hypothetical protein